jgi:bifunctional non-homologous end joining protein LigD
MLKASAPSARRNASSKSSPKPATAVTITHPERVVFSELGLTKLDVANYYASVTPQMLPHLQGRPLTLVFCPKGVDQGCQYLRHSKVWGPKPIRRVRIQEKTKVGEYMVVDTPEALLSLAQMNVLEVHTWNSTVDHIEQPDRLVLDLDPGARIGWTQVIAAARLLRSMLSELKLKSWVKTTGGRGLHVVVPLIPATDWSVCLEFARQIASIAVEQDPNLYTTDFRKAGREDKILIDYLRNNRTNTSICAFSVRARRGAPVSVPISWTDLKPSLVAEQFTVRTVPAYLKRRRADPWKDYWSTRQRLP